MTDLVRKYVEAMTDTDLMQCMQDYEEYEIKGSMGDTVLRRHVECVMSRDSRGSAFLLWLEIFIKEVYRVFAYRYINECVGWRD